MVPSGSGSERDPVPRYLGTAELPESGWERLRELWQCDELQQYPEETVNIIKATFSAAVIGWMYGGLPAFRHAKEQFIERSQGEVFHNRLDAVQSAHRAGLRGFLRYGWRWSWRIAAFVAIFNSVSTGLSVYRNKTTISHFAAAGAFTGGVFRMHLGLTRFVAGSVFGAALGTPVGGLMMAIHNLSGETMQERRTRERRLRYEQKLADWKVRLSVTDIDLEEIVSNTQEGSTKRDVEKIQELNFPKNPLPSEDTFTTEDRNQSEH